MVQVPSASPQPRGRAALRPAVAASLVLHALVLLIAVRGRVAAGGELVPAPAPAADTATDVWVGDTSLPGSGRVIDIETHPGAAARAGAGSPEQPGGPPAAPRPAAVPAPAPPTEREARAAPEPAPTVAATAQPRKPPVVRTKAPPRPSASIDPLAAALAGGSRAAARAVDGAHQAADDGEAEPTPAAGSTGGGRFGAAGEPAGVRDLGRAFTRAIPPAVSSDPIWGKLPVGSAGRHAVVVSVDASGHITGHTSSDREPPRHLVKMVERTVALLESGTFALRGQVGAGTQALVLSVMLRDEPPQAADETRGLNLAFEYDGSRGKASFTQAGGRRVEVTIRVEPPTRTP
jgi:hypothetical protein